MGLSKMKKRLAEALQNGDTKEAKKAAATLRRRRAEKAKPRFPGAHRGY